MNQSTWQNHLKAKYGPWAVVTGASDGIGLELSREMARAGLNTVLVARRRERLDALAEDLESEFGTTSRVVIADLSVPEQVGEFLQTTTDLDVGLFAACAGFGTSGDFVDTDFGSELSMIDVNCRALCASTRHFAERFVRQKRGGIILMSSLVAFQGVPRAANYAATKAYVQTFAEGIRRELLPHGVDVLASAPGPVNSGFGGRANMQMGSAASADTVAQGTLRALGRQAIVRPGLLAKFLELSLSTLPRWGRTRIMQQVMGGMTKHQ